MSVRKPNRREVGLTALLKVAAGSDRQAFYQARNEFEKRHGSVRKSRDGKHAAAEFERHALRFALLYERVQLRVEDEIREILENYSDRRRAAGRHDPPAPTV